MPLDELELELLDELELELELLDELELLLELEELEMTPLEPLLDELELDELELLPLDELELDVPLAPPPPSELNNPSPPQAVSPVAMEPAIIKRNAFCFAPSKLCWNMSKHSPYVL